MRLSTVILPIYRWPEGRLIWQRAEELGFHAAYTYDHLTWRSFRDHPWFGSIPTLTAAATATTRLRLGTLVTSPNFRHPVLLAKELMTMDDISGGRLTVGIGAGGTGFDATAFGQPEWPPGERTRRFAEFVTHLDELLSRPATTTRGEFYAAVDARSIPGCIQQPRVPFYVAATGPRGLAVAARHGQGWVTYGASRDPSGVPADQAPGVVARQLEALGRACEEVSRDPHEVTKVLLEGSTAEKPLASLDAFVDWAGTYQAVGIDELVVHWPVAESDFANDLDVFERIATEGLAQLAD